MNKPLSKLQQFQILRPVPKSKALRQYRQHRADEILAHDIQVAITYAAMQRMAQAHNLAVGAYAAAPRASPAVH